MSFSNADCSCPSSFTTFTTLRMKWALGIGGKLHEETHSELHWQLEDVHCNSPFMTVHMCWSYEFAHSSCPCNAMWKGVSSGDSISLLALIGVGLPIISSPCSRLCACLIKSSVFLYLLLLFTWAVWTESKMSTNIRLALRAADTCKVMASQPSCGSTSSFEHRISANLTPELPHPFVWCQWVIVSFGAWTPGQPVSGRKWTDENTRTATPCQNKDPCNPFPDNTCQKTPLEQLGNRTNSCWCFCWVICHPSVATQTSGQK